MTDIIVIVIIAGIALLASLYVYKAKKSGKKCIGCPESGSCGKNCCSSQKECGGSCAHCHKH